MMTTQEMLVNDARLADLHREAEIARRHRPAIVAQPSPGQRVKTAMIELGQALLRYTPEPSANFEPNPVR